MSEELARRFHEIYERLAPSFGYETRTETRAFEPTTPNGRLMIAVTDEIEDALQARITELTVELAALREQVRWIPVSERLPELKTCASREDIICPEDYTIVITVDDKGYVSPAYFSYDGMFLDDYETPAEPMVYGKTLFFSECLDYSSEIINNVTHWMPLPLPPEGE